MSLIDTLKNESSFKLGIAAVVTFVVLYLTIFNPRDEKYMQDVTNEILLAKKICEASRETVLGGNDKRKLGSNVLDDVRIDGNLVELKLVKYPRVLFFETGYRHKDAGNELFCSFSDPRDSSRDFYYDYERGLWVNNMRMRR